VEVQMFVVVLLVGAVVAEGVVGLAALGRDFVKHTVVAEALQDAVDGYTV